MCLKRKKKYIDFLFHKNQIKQITEEIQHRYNIKLSLERIKKLEKNRKY